MVRTINIRKALFVWAMAAVFCGFCFAGTAYAEGEIERVGSFEEMASAEPLDIEKTVVDKDTGTTNGESFEEVFDESLPGEDNVSRVIEDTGEYQVVSETNDKVTAVSNFATKKLIVLKELSDLYGAESGACFDGQTVLTYATEEATREGFETLTVEFGKENVIPDYPMTPSARGWGTHFMNLDSRSRQMASVGRGVTVAVIDTGIRKSHSIFSGRKFSPYSKSFAAGVSPYSDDWGHGTSVAGILAESTPANVQIMSLRTYDKKGNGDVLWLVSAINYAAAKKVDVINVSTTMPVDSYYAKYMDGILKNATDKGCVIVGASGNSGINLNRGNYYPGESPYCFCVGSIWSSVARSTFSNYGTTLDFCAPGEGLTVADNWGDKRFADGAFGTSFATPYISACAALVKLQTPSKTPAQVKSELISRCVDYGAKGKDSSYGYGMPKFPLYKPGGAATTSAKWVYKKNSYKPYVAWKASAGAVSYQVQITSVPKNNTSKARKYGKKYTATVSVKARQYTFGKTFTKNNKTYSAVKVRVRAWNKAGFGSWSAWRTVK